MNNDNPFKKHGINILLFLNSHAFQTVLSSSREYSYLSNETIALAVLHESDQLKSRVLAGLNRVRRRSVEYFIQKYKTYIKPDSEKIQEAQEAILNIVVAFESRGYIVIYSDLEREIPVTVDDECFQQPDWIEKIGKFDLTKASFKDILHYWLPVARYVRRETLFVLDFLMEKLKDPYSRFLFELSLDDHGEEVIVQESERKQKSLLMALDLRLEIVRTGIWCLGTGATLNETVSRLNSLFEKNMLDSDAAKEAAKKIEKPAVTEEMENHEVMINLVAFLLRAHDKGLLCLEKCLPDLEPYSRLGLEMTVDGLEPVVIHKLLENKKKAILHELEIKMRMFETLCLGLRNGTNPYILHRCLNSYLVEGYELEEVFD